MATVDFDINQYRRTYYARHPEKQLQYRKMAACRLLLRLCGLDGAKALLDTVSECDGKDKGGAR